MKIKQAPITARIGEAFGKGLADVIPREVENYRFSNDLKQFEQNSANLSPQEYFTRALSIPGLRNNPQAIQSLAELAKQQAQSQAFSQGINKQQQQQQEFPKLVGVKEPEKQASASPSLTTGEELEKVKQGHVPRSVEEIETAGIKSYNQSPAYFKHNPQAAIDREWQIEAQREKQATAAKTRYENLDTIQQRVVDRLKNQSERFSVKVPSTVYDKVEDEAITATQPKRKGGEGLSEQEAMKKYGEKMDQISKSLAQVDEVAGYGGWGVVTRPAKNSLTTLKDAQRKMEALDATDELAQHIVATSKVTPNLAYAISQPVSKVPELNKVLKSLPKVPMIETLAETKADPTISVPKTLEIAPQLAKIVKSNEKASPLAIAYEIEKKGYDPQTWLDYLVDNAEKLNLTTRQARQASTVQNSIKPFNDWWFSSFSGVE